MCLPVFLLLSDSCIEKAKEQIPVKNQILPSSKTREKLALNLILTLLEEEVGVGTPPHAAEKATSPLQGIHLHHVETMSVT